MRAACDNCSIAPALMPHGQAVQERAAVLPFRHEPIHKRDEVRVVGWFEKVNQFVNHDVFQARSRFLREIGVETNGASLGAATSPLGLHPLHKENRESRRTNSAVRQPKSSNASVQVANYCGKSAEVFPVFPGGTFETLESFENPVFIRVTSG
jgi:hypothetical protein